MAHGTVKWFDANRGYGFIKRQDGPDLFVHRSDVRAASETGLREGERVEFEVERGPKGLQAAEVRRL